jgi:hypothetical protein
VRVRIAAAVAAVVAVAGCGDESPSTSLSLVATNPFVGRATFTLECDPAGGDVPRPATACERLARDPSVLLRPKRFVCAGGTFSWWGMRITGRYDGKPVDVRTDTCWTPQMALIRALGIGSEIQRHVDPLSRPAYPGSGIPRSELAEQLDIPPATPGWLVRIARIEARRLGDPRPDRLEIELGNAFVIELEGDFVCRRCGPPGAEPRRVSHVRIVVDKRSRRLDSVLVGDPS